MKRITADIDSKNILELAWYIYQALKRIKKIKSIEITPSNSKGYHLLIYTSYPYNKKQTFKLREAIGDDIHRITIDKIRKLGTQTLFSKKTKIK